MSQPCLPIPRRKRQRDEITDGGNDFDSIQSMDAEEYLSRVVRQAKKLPDVFVAIDGNDESSSESKGRNHVPIEGSAASLSYFFSGRTDLTPPLSNDVLPKDPAWMDTTISNFDKLRTYLETCKTKGIGGKKTNRTAFPPMKDRSGWHVFCVGKDEASGNSNSYFGDDGNNDENEDKDEEVPLWEKGVPSTGYQPSVRLILQMDQVLVRRVLSHLIHYICEGWSAFTPQRLAWIYALLSRLEKPIHRDDAAMLFSLLKVLTKTRARTKPNEKENLAKLNVLILLIGVYFEQGGGVAGVMSIKS